ncbi:hypothetical protein [Vulcanisaeta sp. JCM 16161]|uniref:hypothetical protein n=1 Tax=Vulcanisaeta sp. JCM 16161 TaxID=1295372 RepID=UPI0006CFE795|nr:hypothetical protein [Vulcanisaeta sp. JCM 16161]
MNIKWQLKAVDHRGVFKNKLEVAEETSKLGDGEFPTFTLYAVLSDGDVNAKRKRVRLYMGYSKLELWSGIIEKLKSLGFGMDRDKGHTIATQLDPQKPLSWLGKCLATRRLRLWLRT